MKNFIILKENRMKIILIKLRKTLHFLVKNACLLYTFLRTISLIKNVYYIVINQHAIN